MIIGDFMDGILKRETPILPGLCDYSAELSLSSAAMLFMDMAMMHAEKLGIGFTGFNERGLFWVAVKTRIKIYKRPKMAETVTVATWPEEAGGFKCNRDYEIYDENGTYAVGKTEWAIIDSNTHVPQKATDIYPEGLPIEEKRVIPQPFEKLKGDFEGELLGTYRLRNIDTDYGKHMNNVAYIRAIEGIFTSEELSRRDFKELEIHYKNPCFEGETLSFYGVEENGILDLKILNEEGKTAVLARLKS